MCNGPRDELIQKIGQRLSELKMERGYGSLDEVKCAYIDGLSDSIFEVGALVSWPTSAFIVFSALFTILRDPYDIDTALKVQYALFTMLMIGEEEQPAQQQGLSDSQRKHNELKERRAAEHIEHMKKEFAKWPSTDVRLVYRCLLALRHSWYVDEYDRDGWESLIKQWSDQ
jgi:hypothetical protein